MPSDDAARDSAALKSIAAAGPFQPLPPEFRGREVTLRVQFLYRLGMEIAPLEVSLLPGKTQQFSVSLGATENPPVSWKVDGPGCTGSLCGTISADGLYTAPADVPSAPVVTVSATLVNLHHLAAESHLVIRKP